MNTLCELISSLRQSEIRALRAQYTLRERNDQDLRGKLLDLILEKKDLTDEIASRCIYGSKPGSSFSHLKNRLWEDVCNILALQTSPDETDVLPARAQVSQLVNVSRVLKARDLHVQSFQLIQQALQLSIKHALVPELMLLKEFISSTFPEFWVKERSKVLSILADSVRREADRLRVLNIAELVSAGDRDARHVAELKTIYRTSSCEQIKAIVHRSMINIHMHSNDKEELMKECIQLYSLAIESHSDPDQRQRNAAAFSDITKAAIHVRSYDSAIIFGKAGLELIGNDILFELECYENLLVAFLNNAQMEEAASAISSIESIIARTNQLEFRRLYFCYLKSWYLFLSGEYKACLKLIAQCPSLPKEKEQWHAGFYVLEMLSLLRSRMYFQIDYRNDAFRKFQIRHELKGIELLDVTYKAFKIFIDNDYEALPVMQYMDGLYASGFLESDPSALFVVDVYDQLKKSFSAAN